MSFTTRGKRETELNEDLVFGDEANVVTHTLSDDIIRESDTNTHNWSRQYAMNKLLDLIDELYDYIDRKDYPHQTFPSYYTEGRKVPEQLCDILERLEEAREALY